MPLIVFDCKGISAMRPERIEAAVEAGGRHVKEECEGWIAANPFRGGARVVITGPLGVIAPSHPFLMDPLYCLRTLWV
jgi:hypothetical protein